MTPVSQAWVKFDAAYNEMLKAAADVRRALAAESGVRCDDPCGIIREIVARFYGVAPADIIAPTRFEVIVTARHVAMWLCRTLTTESLSSIGRSFNRDHGTVSHAVVAVNNRRDTDTRFVTELIEIRQRCEKALQR